MAQHTPGPWMVTDTGAGYSITHRYATPDRSPGFEHKAGAIVHTEADAQAIAANPDLLAALRRAASLIQARPLDAAGLDTLAAAWAAIAKARGEQVSA